MLAVLSIIKFQNKLQSMFSTHKMFWNIYCLARLPQQYNFQTESILYSYFAVTHDVKHTTVGNLIIFLLKQSYF